MKNFLFFVWGFICLFSGNAISQDTISKRIYTTTYLEDMVPPKIDGIINDEAWDLVRWSGNYVEWSPDENTEPSYQSKLKILYDEKNIYVAFRCYDNEPEKIVSRLSRRDGFDGDWVEINIGSLGDLRTAYSFTISVSGVLGDEYISNDGGNWDNTWNPIWYAKTNIDDQGWTAEIRIPLSQIRFGKEKKQIWGIQSTRRFFRKEERSVWQRTPRNAPGWVSSFGELHGITNLKSQKQLEIQPYLVASQNELGRSTLNPLVKKSETKLNLGLDGKWGITNDLTLDFTINPDFGQVEADPSAIALDGFQIFFQERRPFFIENKNIFDYTFSSSVNGGRTFGFDNLFYSRRIGRSPQGATSLAENEFSDQPNITTILGAAKFSGKTQDGWSIGILEAVTEKETADIVGPNGEREETVEPFTNYLVSRIQKDFNDNNTFIGGIFTATNRNLSDNLEFLHESAYTGGLDFTHNWKNRAYYFKGNFVFSKVNGSAQAITRTQQSITHLFQREGADHLDVATNLTTLTGSGGNIQVGKGAGNWLFQTGVTWRSPELELNDLGFQLRADDMRYYGWVGYRTTKPLKNMRAWRVNYNQFAAFDFGGNFNELLFNINAWLNLKDNTWINLFSDLKPVNYNNFLLRGGPRFRLPPEYTLGGSITSDNRKKLRFGVNFSNQIATENALSRYSVGGSITYQPLNALTISLSPSYTRVKDKLQYVSANSFVGRSRYILGEIEQQTFNIPLRLDYILTPTLSLQYWGQPFISQGRYQEFKYVNDPIANTLNDRISLFSNEQINLESNSYQIDENIDGTVDYSFIQPDFSFIQWRSNMVLRWEYTPGSELYFVWSQDASNFGNFNNNLTTDLKENIKDVNNIFLIKFTYRFLK
ncbi:carbohydrate binding family 9 domain-containing protein [Aquimarina sp. D1M17]|uniref:DUF5916 domain-containing protein n=1 Tax=Aquimarina acroporae TaxID=2937283 RepID=UPI0020BFFD30|nr:DUF5916 domain-containing protein [Aquimarina acroporae]MCK8521784.1 carbohydrate binding family 9 domain-containing protein [Aquimarina acroporae]